LEYAVIAAGIYILCQICFLRGALKERESKVCMSEYEMRRYEQTLNVAELICVGVQEYKTAEFNKYKGECEQQITKLKNNYKWLQSQQGSSTPVKI